MAICWYQVPGGFERQGTLPHEKESLLRGFACVQKRQTTKPCPSDLGQTANSSAPTGQCKSRSFCVTRCVPSSNVLEAFLWPPHACQVKSQESLKIT